MAQRRLIWRTWTIIDHGKCDPGTCDDLKTMYELTKYRSQKEPVRRRYIFDVDGNAWSGRSRWLCDLISKSATYPEWFVTPISSSPMAVDVSPPSPTMNNLSA
ncbi:hypothetical protein EV421DRAFT_1903970 [Armillaria borealis]|uniref:Uncharacterized protein n=1 Tax=Armillaria borealis TaxID=47425 RepID=A0AA39JIT1_9AGAR|nr:hypothetical protein EV421DRAFT_1903970 [Armillaria borealis]